HPGGDGSLERPGWSYPLAEGPVDSVQEPSRQNDRYRHQRSPVSPVRLRLDARVPVPRASMASRRAGLRTLVRRRMVAAVQPLAVPFGAGRLVQRVRGGARRVAGPWGSRVKSTMPPVDAAAARIRAKA